MITCFLDEILEISCLLRSTHLETTHIQTTVVILCIALSHAERAYEDSRLKAELYEILLRKEGSMLDPKKKKSRELSREPKERGRDPNPPPLPNLMKEMAGQLLQRGRVR